MSPWPAAIRATALSIHRTCGDVGLLAGPILLGAIADESSVGTALVVNAAVLAVAGGAFRLVARDDKPWALAEAAAGAGTGAGAGAGAGAGTGTGAEAGGGAGAGGEPSTKSHSRPSCSAAAAAVVAAAAGKGGKHE